MKLTSDDIKWNEGKDYAVVSELGGVYQYSYSIARLGEVMLMIENTSSYIVRRELEVANKRHAIDNRMKHHPVSGVFGAGLAEAAKRVALNMRCFVKAVGRLTSDQIKWKSNATYAIVAIDDNVVEEQVDIDPGLSTAKSFIEVGDYSYSGAHHYQVKRELEQIKPTVSHCVRVYKDGSTGQVYAPLCDLIYFIDRGKPHKFIHHYNGKQKFRLVYKAD